MIFKAITKSGKVISLESDEVFDELKILPGTPCMTPKGFGYVVGMNDDFLFFALEKDGYQVSYWDDIQDQQSFSSKIITLSDRPVIDDTQLANLLSHAVSQVNDNSRIMLLPNEIFAAIFYLLPWQDKISLLLVCSRFNQLLNNENFSYLWKAECDPTNLKNKNADTSFKSYFFQEKKTPCFAVLNKKIKDYLANYISHNPTTFKSICYEIRVEKILDKLYETFIGYKEKYRSHIRRNDESSNTSPSSNVFLNINKAKDFINKDTSTRKYNFIIEINLPIDVIRKIIRFHHKDYGSSYTGDRNPGYYDLLESITRIHPDPRYHQDSPIDFKELYKDDLKRELDKKSRKSETDQITISSDSTHNSTQPTKCTIM